MCYFMVLEVRSLEWQTEEIRWHRWIHESAGNWFPQSWTNYRLSTFQKRWWENWNYICRRLKWDSHLSPFAKNQLKNESKTLMSRLSLENVKRTTRCWQLFSGQDSGIGRSNGMNWQKGPHWTEGSCTIQRTGNRANEMSWLVTILTAKSDSMCLTLQTRVVEERTDPPQVVFWSPHVLQTDFYNDRYS